MKTILMITIIIIMLAKMSKNQKKEVKILNKERVKTNKKK